MWMIRTSVQQLPSTEPISKFYSHLNTSNITQPTKPALPQLVANFPRLPLKISNRPQNGNIEKVTPEI